MRFRSSSSLLKSLNMSENVYDCHGSVFCDYNQFMIMIINMYHTDEHKDITGSQESKIFQILSND